MAQLLKYPRGYVARATPLSYYGFGESDDVAHEFVDVSASGNVEELYRLYMTRGANAGKWAFRRRVIYHCALLFGDFKDWLTLQVVRNDNIYGLNLSFLHDTVQYIRTGKRDMNIHTWKELLLDYPDPQIGAASRHRLESFRLLDGEFDNYIGQWCSHPNGLEDMLWTAHVLFGSGKSRLLNHPLL